MPAKGITDSVSSLSCVSPQALYQERLEARQGRAKALAGHLDRLGLIRLGVFLAILLVAWLTLGLKWASPFWLLFPTAAFFYCLVRFSRIRRQLRRAERSVRFYSSGLDRLQDRWMGLGNPGTRFQKEDHLYAADLDLFGKGSLFERLCMARTQLGEERLASWLLAPADPGQIPPRQEAVRELTPNLDLREEVGLLGAEVPPIDLSQLEKWGLEPNHLPHPGLGWLVLLLALVNLLTLVGWLVIGWSSLPLLISLAISGILTWQLHNPVQKILKPIETMYHDLVVLQGLLARMEKEPFSSPLLRALKDSLQVDHQPPSWRIGQLAFWVDWLDATRNQFFIPFAIVLLWRTQMAFALERWRRQTGPTLGQWLEAIAQIEALNSLAGFALENPEHVYPQIVTAEEAFWEGEALGHPLLPQASCVRNDVRLVPPVRLLVISGSNMSGKSTLLRTVGSNTVLALAGAPVRARKLRLTPVALAATLRVQDSLLEGKSRFFAEISRIRQILDKAQGGMPVLFLLDEVFHGTNSHDRGLGAEALLRRLLEDGSLGLVTTHDLSLTQITGVLEQRAINVHFADQFVEGQMHFDYTMRPGVVPRSNALALMRAIGLEV